MRDLRRAPARCSIRPLHHPKAQVAACSRAGASRGLFVTSPCRSGKPPQHGTRRTRCKTAFTTPGRIVAELYGSASRAHVEIQAPSELMGPSSAGFALWALPYTTTELTELQLTCSCLYSLDLKKASMELCRITSRQTTKLVAHATRREGGVHHYE